MQTNTEYDPEAVRSLTRRLHRRAAFVSVLWPIIGILAGGYGGLQMAGNFAAGVGALVGGFVGYLIGSMRWLHYSVEAQNALCLKQIEENTRVR